MDVIGTLLQQTGKEKLNTKEPPDGTITFLFTDIEGSTRLWERFPDVMPTALARHDALLRQSLEAYEGYIFKTVGDAFFAAFSDPVKALKAAIEIQTQLQTEAWQSSGLPSGISIKVRITLHTGVAQQRDQDYFGPTLNRLARILSAGHGGQILLSEATAGLVSNFLPLGTELRDMGQRRLKDLPSPEQIFQVVVPGLSTEFPPLKTLDNRPIMLPAPPTSFIGRTQEVGAVRNLLRQPQVRLLSLTGPGGTGKTRLSLEVAAGLVDEFEDGVFFVALAAISEISLVPSAIAQTLNIKEKSDQILLETLKTYLQKKQLLLVLDNFEQILEAAPIVSELLSAAPRLKVLVSTREALYLYGEQEFEVPPLALPDLRNLPTLALSELSQNEAIALFVQRTQAVKVNFELTITNAPMIAQICTRLDGLPLAIELAAVRSRQLTPEAMLDQLNGVLGAGLDLLSLGPRDLPTRQRTLRGAIEWSYKLLDEDEKLLFERLSIFSGGWSASAAQAICSNNISTTNENSEPGAGWAKLWTELNSLNEKSLIRQNENNNTPTSTTNSNVYQGFMMLETIREYALEQLAQRGELEQIQCNHAKYYVELAETAEPELRGPQQVEWTTRLEVENDNLRGALSWLLKHDQPGELELALRLAGSLRWFWEMHNYLSEGRQWLEVALAKDTNLIPTAIKAKALNTAGVLAYHQADYPKSILLLTKSLQLQRQLQDKLGIAKTLNNLGNVATMQGDYTQAHSYFEECLELQRELYNIDGIATGLGNVGLIALFQGNYVKAGTLFKEALTLHRQLENKVEIAGMLLNVGCVMLYQGEHEQGTSIFSESLELFRELGNKFGLIQALEGLAGIAGAQMQAERAARLFGAAECLREGINAPLAPSDQLFYAPIVDTTRKLLGQADFEKFWNEGRSLNLEQALGLALSY